MKIRLDKKTYYLGIAHAVAERSTCLRVKCGAVIVVNDQIVATGYVGSPRDEPNCCDVGTCKRDELHIKPGQNYELCNSVHAEQNCIINAARSGSSILDGSIYIYLERIDGRHEKHGGACQLCSRMLKNAGVKEVIIEEINGEK